MSRENIITSYEEYLKTYFPERYKKQIRQNTIKKIGFGKYIAKSSLEKIAGSKRT